MGLKVINLPDLGEGVTEGEIMKIKVSEGETISMDQALLEVMTDKASMEVPSFIEGKIQKIEVSEGDIVPVGAKLFTILTEENDTVDDSQSLEQDLPLIKKVKSEDRKALSSLKEQKDSIKQETLAIPSTRRLAKDLNVSLDSVKGTGPAGEIKREDLLNHIKSLLKTPLHKAVIKHPLLPDLSDEEKRVPLKGVKRLMFNSMTLSKATIPHFTIGERVQIGRLIKLRLKLNSHLKSQGLKIGYLPFFIRAISPILREFPIFNSVYSPATKEIIFRKDINIGFAVDSPQGLLVPVLKHTQNKKFMEIVKEIKSLVQKVREETVERENLTGASITLSNVGSLGGFYGTPIINPPEMAIMGIYRVFQQTIKTDKGEFKEKPFMNFSITCDHRFIDGAAAARFLKSFKDKIEQPSWLFLE